MEKLAMKEETTCFYFGFPDTGLKLFASSAAHVNMAVIVASGIASEGLSSGSFMLVLRVQPAQLKETS